MLFQCRCQFSSGLYLTDPETTAAIIRFTKQGRPIRLEYVLVSRFSGHGSELMEQQETELPQ